MNNDDTARLRSVDEAARLLGVSIKTTRRLINTRRLPSVKICRRVLIPNKALLQFIHSNTLAAVDAEGLAADIVRY